MRPGAEDDVREALEQDRRGVELAASPHRTIVKQLGSRHAEHQDRGVARPIRDVLDQVQEGRLAPLDVVEHDRERTRLRDRLQEPSYGPEGLLGGAVVVGGTEELCERRARGALLAVAQDRADLPLDLLRRVEVVKPCGLLHDLTHREERDPLAVGETSTAEHGRLVSHGAQELGDESRLADPRRAEHREQLARAVGHRGVERLPELRERPVAADHGGVEPPRDARDPGRDLDQPERRDRVRLALHHQRLDRLGGDRVANQPHRVAAEQDGARIRGLLEPRRDVHRVAGDERLPLRVPGDDLAGVDADPRCERHAVIALQLFVERDERFPHLTRRAHRADRVVLVHVRDAEDRHHRVTDELLDGAAVAFERGPHLVEVSGHDAPERLGIEPFAHRGRAGDVAEDDRDGPARLVLRRRGGQW